MIKTVLISILFLLGIVFIFQNQEVILSEFFIAYDIKVFSFENQSLSNYWLLIIAFLLGVLICLISMGVSLVSKSLKINELQKKINTLEQVPASKEAK
ncbi:MAG: LapA family protein [Thermodesulfobacteriota bacterium]|nr:LapA family protein [Thermodesulfobacteriota bacterium]